MTLLGQTQMELVTVILTVLLGLSSTGDGMKQELRLYKEDGTALHFHTHVPDLIEYSATLPKINRVCSTGMWFLSTTVNYQTYGTYLGDGTNNTICSSYNMANVKSLRHFGANDTETDAISLYPGYYYYGEEIFATETMADIPLPIKSLAATGTSDWMLFEGKNFDGKSICFTLLRSYECTWAEILDLNMKNIGSVFKGCDLDEIQLYRESLFL